MTGLDTNIIVRYLVWDDVKQAKKAEKYILKAIEGGEKCFINLIVLCELIWVLESAYKFSRDEIEKVCQSLLRTKQLEIEKRDLVKSTLRDYVKGRADFADYLIGRINNEYGCEVTLTFDRKTRNSPFFRCLYNRI